jgi:pimeloyl-ACP methyl ester carboxylesterase
LSIELPQVKDTASDENHAAMLDQASTHILSAQAFLQNKGAKRIILIAYGLGARMAVDWLSKTPQSAVQALVLISMADGKQDSGIDSNQELLKIKIPVLDIYAEHDALKVIQAATERKHYRSQMQQYRQLEIIAADQYYSQLETELVKRVRGWLRLTFKNQ